MATEYHMEKAKDRTHLIRECVENARITYAEGLSAADSEDYNRPRDRKRFLEEFLNPMIEAGKIGNGVKTKFDDRKFRFDSAKVKSSHYDPVNLFGYPSEIELKLGITTYQECATHRKRTEKEIKELRHLGTEKFKNKYAFFSRGCAICVVPITSEGAIFVGKRKVPDEDSGFANQLATVNGWIDYKENLKNIDFTNDALREAREEYGIDEKKIKELIFAGVFSTPALSDTDFVYIAQTKLPNKFFSNGHYKQIRQDDEHNGLIKIASYKDMQELLATGKFLNSQLFRH